MDHYCHFHPNSPAKWRCNECNRLYDNACLPQCNEKLQQATCPSCQKSLIFLPSESVSANDIYTVKRLFLDAFSSHNLSLIIASVSLSILFSLLDFNTTLTFLASLSMTLLLSVHFSRQSAYFMHLYQQTGKRRIGHGRRKDSALSTVLSPTTSIQLMIVAGILLLLPVYVFYFLHWLPGLLLMTIGGASFPYLIIFSLHSSDNEQNITLSKLFKEIRPFMAKLSFSSLGLYWLALVATDFSTIFSSLIITLGISAFFSMLGLIVSINLSTKIFIITERKFAARSAKPIDIKGPTSVHHQASITSLDTDIDQALKMGQYDKVVSLLEESIKRNGNSTLRRQQLFLMLVELKDLVKLSRYAELFIDWMLDRNKIKDASQFIYQLRKHDPTFLIHDLKLINSLAKQFLRAKKYALVLWLAEDAKTRFQVCEELASLYLSGAQALITHFKDLEKAEEYLLFIIQSCDGSPSTESAKALLIHLQNNQRKQQDLRS